MNQDQLVQTSYSTLHAPQITPMISTLLFLATTQLAVAQNILTLFTTLTKAPSCQNA